MGVHHLRLAFSYQIEKHTHDTWVGNGRMPRLLRMDIETS
jgi:hypothetical protein